MQGVFSGVTAVIILFIFGNYFPASSNLVGFLSTSFVVSLVFILFLIVRGINEEDRALLEIMAKKNNL